MNRLIFARRSEIIHSIDERYITRNYSNECIGILLQRFVAENQRFLNDWFVCTSQLWRNERVWCNVIKARSVAEACDTLREIQSSISIQLRSNLSPENINIPSSIIIHSILNYSSSYILDSLHSLLSGYIDVDNPSLMSKLN